MNSKRKVAAARRGRKRRVRVGTLIWRVFWLLVAVIVGALVGIYFTTNAPAAQAVKLPTPSTVYFADGTTEIGKLSTPSRKIVPLAEVAPVMRDAVVAGQDPLFYQRPKLALTDVFSGMWESLWGGRSADEQSLTLAYAQAVSRGHGAPILGELRDTFLPVRIDQTLSKDKILENYLNVAYFGRGAYGVEAAAQTYFGVSAKDLSLPQAALLAALLPAPCAWDPAVNAEQAQVQFAKVIAALVSAEKITAEQAQDAQFPQVQAASASGDYAGTNGYLLALVKDELTAQAHLSATAIDQGQLTVITTIDAANQQAAVDAVAGVAEGRPAALQTGLIALAPESGAIMAVYGGSDYAQRATNNATQQRIPASSPYKALALVENFEADLGVNNTYEHWANGYLSGDTFNSIPMLPSGLVSIGDATKFNQNDPFVRLEGDVGADAIQQRAVDLGIPADAPGTSTDRGSSLGRVHVTAQEMARIYAAIADDGKITTPHAVQEVRAGKQSIYSAEVKSRQAIPANSAKLTTYLMQTPFSADGLAAAEGGAFAAQRPAAGIPSTAVDKNVAWFVGYTPQIVTAVTMYQLDDAGALQDITPYGDVKRVDGTNYPLRVWSAFMSSASEKLPVKAFPDVSELVQQATKTQKQ